MTVSTHIRISSDFTAENDFLFWEGDEFEVFNDDLGNGAEIKTAGEYVWIPADKYDVIRTS